jgi:hypothetical protein
MDPAHLIGVLKSIRDQPILCSKRLSTRSNKDRCPGSAPAAGTLNTLLALLSPRLPLPARNVAGENSNQSNAFF